MAQRTLTGYGRLIAPLAPGYDPRHIEAYMRLEHPTLDGLSRQQFAEEIEIAKECVNQAGTADSEALAVTFGL